MEIVTRNMPVIISALFFLAILLFIAGLYSSMRRQTRKRRLREKISAGGSIPGGDTPDRESRSLQTIVASFFSFLGRRIAPEQSADYSPMRTTFLRAGLRGPNVLAMFWGIKGFLAASLAVSFLLVRMTFIKVIDPTMSLAITMLLALLGFYVPDLILRIKTSRRKTRILHGLPDALDLLVVCVEAGMGLDSAINRVAEEIALSSKTLSDELRYFNLEMRAGKSRQGALRNLATRIDLEDMNSFVTLLIQTDKFGTSIAQALRVYSDSFRTARYRRAEEMAAKLPVKLIMSLILFIFPSLFVVILGPSAIRVYQVFLKG